MSKARKSRFTERFSLLVVQVFLCGHQTVYLRILAVLVAEGIVGLGYEWLSPLRLAIYNYACVVRSGFLREACKRPSVYTSSRFRYTLGDFILGFFLE